MPQTTARRPVQRQRWSALGQPTIPALLISTWVLVLFATIGISTQQAPAQTRNPATDPERQESKAAPSRSMTDADPATVVKTYCVTCHNSRLRTAGLALDTLDIANPGTHAEVWEKVIAKLRQGSMPPPKAPRPDPATYDAVASSLERKLDQAWAANPNPGPISPVHRLNRLEYNNAIHDLLGLDIDVSSELPSDETADGSFDNFGSVLSISTAHLDSYLSVAREVTRLAVGLPPANPSVATYEIPILVTQDDQQSEDLPFGSRGGIAVPYNFPVDGEYSLKVKLRTNWQDYIQGMGWPEQLDVRLDGKRVRRFTVGGDAPGRPSPESYSGPGEPGSIDWEQYMMSADRGLEVRVPVTAGPHVVSVSFVREQWEPEGIPQPVQRGRLLANDETYMDHKAIQNVQIGGPYEVSRTTTQNTPSRRTIFVCEPTSPADEAACATKILSQFARRAYRRPVSDKDMSLLLGFFKQGRQQDGSFDAGIQFALEFVLTDPDFLLRVHPQSAQTASIRPAADSGNRADGLTDLELASRLSFFLWSSIPDDTLLNLAQQRRLSGPAVLEQQVKRMLADPRAVKALVGDFAAQWLNLRRIGDVIVDPNIYPDFDQNLLDDFKTETEMFVAWNIRQNRPLSELLNANYAFVNERLARQYGLPGIYGSRFRRVTLSDSSKRGGLLAQGSLLAVTSYPDRTSPVLRGKWLLDNILGFPIPPPPPGVDTNIDNKPGEAPKSIKERLENHRKLPQCAACHSVIDPVGFALENFDVIGGWRTIDETGHRVDSEAMTSSGQKVEGFSGLRDLLLERPQQFPLTVIQKLLAYAVGRRLDYYDQPAVRKIAADAAANNYRWSDVILGVVRSVPFSRQVAPTASARTVAQH